MRLLQEIYGKLNKMLYKLNDLGEVALAIIRRAGEKKIWIFTGEMGAGKTTLIKSICGKMGVKGHIQSPTFSIINEYITDSGQTIYHFDFYRLKNQTEALDFGVEEYLDSGNICLLEWAERIESLLPENCFEIKISLTDDLTREIFF